MVYSKIKMAMDSLAFLEHSGQFIRKIDVMKIHLCWGWCIVQLAVFVLNAWGALGFDPQNNVKLGVCGTPL